MRFEVLGALRLVRDGTVVEVGPAKQRALLAALLARAGRPVPTGALVEVLWGERPSAGAGDTLRWHVHRLRRLLDDPSRLTRLADGYALRLDPGDLDAREFMDLCDAAGDATGAAEASRRLRQALDLWRGDAYGDLADLAGVREVARVLDERRLAALERRCAADLDLGRHGELVAELSAVVAAHPLREGFRAQLMLALYRCGRRADALAAYREGRTLSVAELGLEPGRQLRELECAILNDGVPPPAGDRPPTPAAGGTPRPAELPADIATFGGRDAEVARLTTALTAGFQHDCAKPLGTGLDGTGLDGTGLDGTGLDGVGPEGAGRGGRPPSPAVVVVCGMSGAGKSALAVHVAHRVADRFPDGQLYVDLQGATPDTTPLPAERALGRFLRSLGVAVPPAADEAEVAARFRSATAGRRLLVVLDNARDAAQVRPLLPASPSCAVLVTSRRALPTLDNAMHHELDVLAATDAVALLGRIVGADRVAAAPEAAERVVRLCGGLPLAVCLAAARLATTAYLSLAELADRLAGTASGGLSELHVDDRAVRDSFAVGYRELAADPHGPTIARTFRLVGLYHGHDLGLTVAAALAGRSEAQAGAALRALAAARLVDNHRPGRYRLHDLLRVFARERAAAEDGPGAGEAVRRALHAQLATARAALAIQHPTARWRAEVEPLALVHPGLPLDGPAAANAWLAAELRNLIAAAEHAERADGDGPAVAVGLSLAIGPRLGVLGHWRESLALAEIAARAARRTGDPRHAAYALRDLGDTQKAMGQLPRALATLTAAAEACRGIGDHHREVSVRCLIGDAHRRLGDVDAALAHLTAGLDLARTLDDPTPRVGALVQLGFAHEQAGRHDDAARAHAEAGEIAAATGNAVAHAASLGNRGSALLHAGRTVEARASYEAALAVDAEAQQEHTVLQAEHLWGLAKAMYALRERAPARHHWRRAAAMLHELGLISLDELRDIETSEVPRTPTILAM